MNTSMSPEERHESRKQLLELFSTSWSCVETRVTYWSTQKNLNSCRNVTPIVYKTGWRNHSEVQFWLRKNEFPTTSSLTEDQSSEWLYEQEQLDGSRGQDLPEWMSESLPDVDPVGLSDLTFTVTTENGRVTHSIEDNSPVLPDSEVTDFPEVMPDDKTEIVSRIWPAVQYLLEKSRNKPTKSLSAWLSDCALALMEIDVDKLKSLGGYLREHRCFPIGWQKEFDCLAMKRRVNSWDVGESTGDVKKAIKAQRQETEEYWYKVPASDQDPRKIAEENEKPPLERKAEFTDLLTRLCFLDSPENVSTKINERSDTSQSGFTLYRRQHLARFIMLKSLVEWPTATTTERQRFMAQFMRKAKLIQGKTDATKFPLESRSYGRVKDSVISSITLNTLIWSDPESKAILSK